MELNSLLLGTTMYWWDWVRWNLWRVTVQFTQEMLSLGSRKDNFRYNKKPQYTFWNTMNNALITG
jgi:hypothetical protein